MAIYALSIKHRAKGKGASAGAHALYIAREGKYGDRGQGEASSHADYLTRAGKHERRSHELEATWSGNMPTWADSPRDFWDAADTYERANGRVYTEVVIALPRELSREGREELVKDFVSEEIGERFPYTVSIHNPKALDGGQQPHAHVMFSTREMDGIDRPKEQFFKRANPDQPERGGARKSREWSFDERDNDRVNEIRASWEELANEALERAGSGERIDRRSLKDQGIDREPEPKMGPAVTQRLKRGQETEVGAKVIELRNYRKREQDMKDLEGELTKERAKVYDLDEERDKRAGAGDDFFSFSGPKREVSDEEKQKYRRTVDLVMTRYEREDGDVEYRWKNSGKVAFVDRGDEISFRSTGPTAIKAGLQVAKEKGWGTVHAHGNEEFRREAWVQGQLMGMEVQGYEATKADKDRVEALKKEQAEKREQYKTRDREERREEHKGRDREEQRGSGEADRRKADRQPEKPKGEGKEQEEKGEQYKAWDRQEPRGSRGGEKGKADKPPEKAKPEPQKGKEGNDEKSGPADAMWAMASEIVKAVDARIKNVRSRGEGASKEDLDDLYRQKHDLTQLGDHVLRVNRGEDGMPEVADPKDLRRRARDAARSQEKDRGIEIDR